MKRITAMILCLAAISLSLFSCGGRVDEEGDVTVVIEDSKGKFEVYMTYLEDVENKQDGLFAVVKHLSMREEAPLHLKYTEGMYGAYFTEIGSIKEDASKGLYITFYTSAETDSYYGAPTATYENVLLHLSGVGANMAAVSAGSVFLFRAEESPY